MTWISIGGPSTAIDTRLIAALSDNIVLGVDANGNVWRTNNSGGDSIRRSQSGLSRLLTFPATLFQSDTIFCDSLVKTVFFSRSGCTAPSVLRWSITGRDSASYSAGYLSYDSISITLHGLKQGSQDAQLILSLDNGTSDTVSLAGFVKISPSALSLSSTNQKIDTLGGTAQVPITINGLDHAEDIDLVLHHVGTMDYLGSFSPTGVKLDIPGEQWPGRSKLHITGAAPGVVAGYARFNVFNDSGSLAHVTFDSVGVLTAVSPCQYALPPAAQSTITPPSGCAVGMISRYAHLAATPVFSVRPNPATQDAWLSSSVDLGDVTVQIFDVLGSQQSSNIIAIRESTPMKLTLPEADGMYNVVIRTASGNYNVRVVRQR